MSKRLPKRTQDDSCFVRMSSDDRKLMEQAIAHQLALVGIDGIRFGVGKFLRNAGVAEARRILGKKATGR